MLIPPVSINQLLLVVFHQLRQTLDPLPQCRQLSLPFWRARIVWKTGRTKTSEEGKRCETRGIFCRAAQDDLTVHYGPETGARTGGQRRSSKNSRQGDGALQAFEGGCGVPVGGLQADYEASARLPKTETRNLLDGHSSWWRLRAEAGISYLKMPFWRARIVWKTGRTKTSEEGKRCETRGIFCRACLWE